MDNLHMSEDLEVNLEIGSEEVEETYEVDIVTRLSAILFVSSKPVSLERLCGLLNENDDVVLVAIEDLKFTFREGKLGFEIVNIGGAFQLRTIPAVKSTLQKLITPKMKRLSKAAAETLAVVAYKQPVARAEIEAIRGVDALPTLKTLLDGNLIRIIGREDTPGSPALYGTTEKFLERFGLSDLSGLPTVREVTELISEESLADEEIEEEDGDVLNNEEYEESLAGE